MFGRKLTPVEISAVAYDEIAVKLRDAGCNFSFVDGMLDLRGIGLQRAPEPAPEFVKHRPISGAQPVKKNTAPGAI